MSARACSSAFIAIDYSARRLRGSVRTEIGDLAADARLMALPGTT